MKIRFLVMTFLLVICLSGCNSEKTPATPDTAGENKSENIVTEEYTLAENGNDISIKYPQFDFLDDNENQKISGAIKGKVLSDMAYEEGNLSISTEYSIVKQTDDNISILIEGMLNAKYAAHPTQIVCSVNYDIKAKRLLEIQDVVTVNDVLVEKLIKNSRDIKVEGVEGVFSDYLATQPQNDIKTTLETCDFLMDEKGITVIYPVPHALGDYVRVETQG